MIPVGLDDPQVLKDICVSQKVWITRLETNVFRIRSEKTSQLRAGLQAMNKLIHNLRLSNDHLSSRFFLLRSSDAKPETVIRMEKNSRPWTTHIDSGRDTMQGHTADLSQFSTELARTFNTLSVLKMYLKMRVSYGQFLVTRMRKEWSNGVSYPNFSRLLNNYARHGAFSFRTQLLQVDKAKQAVRALTEPLHDHIDGEGAVRYQCSLELVVENGGTLHGEAIAGDRLSLRLSAPKFIAFERHPRLDWSMAVPDMKSDWNLQVNAGVQLDVPEHLQRLWQNIELRPMDGDQATVFEEFASPEILVKPHIGSTNAIATTRLKMSAIIPFTDPRYAVQISVTRAWDGLKQGNPRVTWGIEFYGSHWEEAINQVSNEDGRKDWGPGFKSLWPGHEEDLAQRIMRFAQYIVDVQKVFEGLDLQDRSV
ncbi:hypothetical protein B0I35DRAFT_142410 [Stachybotrys elegans]|uniref:DUF7905 domain-containing protein n=1 Tax=Stachybotrys elegans TaxID=80388 RepID=A0A8K0T2G3_9HYPO|nr:hypothetical protein B0I35DRAFT_142410 [Stachybotrys elegans]